MKIIHSKELEFHLGLFILSNFVSVGMNATQR